MKDFIYVVVIVVLSVFTFNIYTSKKSEESRYEQNLKASNDTIKRYKNKHNHNVASIKSFQLTEKELRKKLKEKDVDLKNVKKVLAYVKSHQEVRVDAVEVVFKDSISCVFNKNFTVTDEWYRFTGKVSNKGLSIFNHTTILKPELKINWKSKGWFRDIELTADLSDENPHVEYIDMEAYSLTIKKKWYEKPFVTVPLGILIGYGLAR